MKLSDRSKRQSFQSRYQKTVCPLTLYVKNENPEIEFFVRNPFSSPPAPKKTTKNIRECSSYMNGLVLSHAAVVS